MKNNSLKILTGLLSLTLLVACTPDKPTSSENPITSSQAPSSEIINSSQSSSETPVVEKGYKIKLGEKEIELTKGTTEGNITNYETTLESVVEGTEVTFYVDGKEKKPSCAELGNNIVLNEKYKTIIHNDASNVKLTLKVSTNGLEVFLEGYTQKVINAFTATVNGENATLTTGTPSTGKVAKFTLTLAIGDKLTVLGDDTPLYIGENAMHFEKEYEAPLPGEYIIEVNEYNRILITEPVLEVNELYLAYVNEEKVTPNFVTPNNPEDKAQFTVDLNKGDELSIKYVDGKTLQSASAVVDCSYTVYVNKDGQVFLSMGNVQLNITATCDGEPLTLESRPAGENFAVYRITVEAGKEIIFYNDNEALPYHDTSETSFTYETAGTYIIYINSSLQVWDEPYVEVNYKEVKVTGIDPKLIQNRNIYIWAWPTNKDGAWVEELAKVNEDGSVTVYIPEGSDNFLLITTFTDKAPDWSNVKSQTNDVKVTETMTTTTITWKTKENVSGGSSTPTTPVTGGVYGLRGNFEGGNDWGTTVLLSEVSNGIYEGTITTTGAAAFKVVRVQENNIDYVEEWIGKNGGDVAISAAGTYKITFNASTKAITFTAA